ncbi:MAG: ABC-type transport system, ATP-binding component [Candidatus Gottesmanbacteria bacterium GW2011_GWA2_41_12]|uniref:ABC-type transport system, ATP-binding component n=2 Tax=Candidatus Gottesmaniibacteriota TaxID=1752720 RepID=A0A0G0XLI9_9BACT|nr:MAG: ABC-type transport system, ATP-binding component [Candidatus Gottesmanbacteria bacterium GW2011_GWC2_39_8]KKR88552.1 MAG: ABC-type transport system, ATP-binding component [Candidatus Gottesmanbacteria bacterium GW2011_GWA2_41_12]
MRLKKSSIERKMVNMNSILEVKDLTKKFDKFTAVDNISFSVKEGEIVGLLGPNGAGKTTTIQMLLGVLSPTSGQISYFGKQLASNRGEIMQQVNFSSTYIDLPWRLSVFENLDVIARLYGIAERKERIREVLKIFGVEDLMNKKMGDLSSGQKTRIFLTKAFLNRPKVLLLDEPTASLDPDVATKVRNFLIQEREKNKTTMLFTSHNMIEVEEVCDRVIFINHGKIIAEDTPRGLARKVKLSEVRFIITDGIKRGLSLSEKNKWKAKAEERVLTISINQEEIARLLSVFADNKIEYSDITIEKPTLEDFFLEASK